MNDDVVEMLLIADDPRYVEAVTDAASVIAKVTKMTAVSTIDVSAITSPCDAMLLRFTREDFDAASGALGRILSGLRDTWGTAARIIMENKRRDQLASVPITRYVLSRKFSHLKNAEDVFDFIRAEIVRRGGKIVREESGELIFSNKDGRTGAFNMTGLTNLARRALMLNESQQVVLFEQVFSMFDGDEGPGGTASRT